jgi:hypothetical protein
LYASAHIHQHFNAITLHSSPDRISPTYRRSTGD